MFGRQIFAFEGTFVCGGSEGRCRIQFPDGGTYAGWASSLDWFHVRSRRTARCYRVPLCRSNPTLHYEEVRV